MIHRVGRARRLPHLGAVEVVLDPGDAPVGVAGRRLQVDGRRRRDRGAGDGRGDADARQRIARRIGLHPADRLVDPDIAVVDVLQPDEDVVVRRVAPLAQDARSARRPAGPAEGGGGRCVAVQPVVVLPAAGGVNSHIDPGAAPQQEAAAGRIVLEAAELDVETVRRQPRLQRRDRRIDLDALVGIDGAGSGQVPELERGGVVAGAHEQLVHRVVAAGRLAGHPHRVGADLRDLVERRIRESRSADSDTD